MLRSLGGWLVATTGFLWLRARWKWLASCLGLALLTNYLHGEYVEYIQLLASIREGDAVVGSLSAAYALKNVVVVGLIVAYLWFEVRLAKGRKQGTPRVAGSRKHGFTASKGASRHANEEHSEAKDDQDEPPPASPDTDDGFDFLRHGRRLRTRSEKIMERK